MMISEIAFRGIMYSQANRKTKVDFANRFAICTVAASFCLVMVGREAHRRGHVTISHTLAGIILGQHIPDILWRYAKIANLSNNVTEKKENDTSPDRTLTGFDHAEYNHQCRT